LCISQLGHYMLAQYIGAFLGAGLVFFTYKVGGNLPY
jgi:glycerol uptake facilitator-like aquaporin